MEISKFDFMLVFVIFWFTFFGFLMKTYANFDFPKNNFKFIETGHCKSNMTHAINKLSYQNNPQT